MPESLPKSSLVASKPWPDPNQKIVAFFSLEYAVENDFPIYAGGLGVLAGDIVLDASHLGTNLAAFGLFYCHGFHAHIDASTSCLSPATFGFQPLSLDGRRPAKFSCPLDDHEVWFQVWFKDYPSTRLFLLDTNLSDNSEVDQKITEDLYDSDPQTMLKQQVLLGFGSIKILRSQNLSPAVYHLNEGHTAFTILALAQDYLTKNPTSSLTTALESVSSSIVATKHTILTGGGLHLEKDKLQSVLGSFLSSTHISLDDLFAQGTHPSHPTTFSTTNFLLRFSTRTSGVSLAHALSEKKIHPHSELIPITNGVNQSRWQAVPHMSALNDSDLWAAHKKNKQLMIDYLQGQSGQSLDPTILTVVWARRFTSYKRPDLLFNNLDELTNMTKLLPAVQFVIAGQTNPADAEGNELAERIKRNLEEKQLQPRILFLTTYNLTLAQKLVSGADIWLNTPIPGLEASGTSGMKSALNGALQFTTNDGWAQEVNWDSFGWILPEENIGTRLYAILEQQIIPIYYKINQDGLPEEWLTKMRQTISLVEQNFTTARLLENYRKKLYLI